MKWNNLQLPGCDSGVSQEMKSRYASLAERIEELDQTRRSLDQQEEAAKTAELSPELIGELGDIRISRIVTWQTEVALRNDIEEWLEEYKTEMRGVIAETFEAIAATEGDIRNRLVGIGYVEIDKHMTGAGKIVPGMIHVHPDYLNAKSRYSEAKANADTGRQCSKQNIEGLAATNREMDIQKGRLSTASAVA